MAWSQRSSDNHWEPEEHHAQVEIHRQSETDAQTEYVRGDSSSASEWSIIRKVNVGVAPCEGAATIQKNLVFKKMPSVVQSAKTSRPRTEDLSLSPLRAGQGEHGQGLL